MNSIVPLEKQSKKAKKTFYMAQRGSWNGVRPTTKVVPSKKLYKRNKRAGDSLSSYYFVDAI